MRHVIRALLKIEIAGAVALSKDAGAIPSGYVDAPRTEWFGSFSSGRLVAVIARHHVSERSELVIPAIAVIDSVRGAGIGSDLLLHAMEPFLSQSVCVVGAVDRASERAQNFYMKLGFTIGEFDDRTPTRGLSNPYLRFWRQL